MKTTSIIRLLAIPLAFGSTAFAKEEKEETIAFDKLPAAVQKTIQSQADAKSATVGEIEKDTEQGKVSYEAEIPQKDGKKFEVEVAEDGSLIKVKIDDDEKDEKGRHEKEEHEEHDDDDDAE